MNFEDLRYIDLYDGWLMRVSAFYAACFGILSPRRFETLRLRAVLAAKRQFEIAI